MSYTQPSVLVYQELENAGGIVNGTPDLEACIVGPAYNVLRYVPGSVASLVKTAATSAATAQGSILEGSPLLNFSVIPPFTVGDSVIIDGAGGTVGSALSAKVIAQAGVVLTLDTVAGATVVNATVNKQGILINPLISNTFNLPGQAPGQQIDTSSIQVFANQAKVETISTGLNGYSGNNALSFAAAAGTGTTTAGAFSLTGVTNPTKFREGDTVSVAAAGVAGATLVSKIITIAGTAFTLANAAGASVSNTAVTKVGVSNVNPVTYTLMVEPGDEAQIEYTDTSSNAKVFTSTVIKVTASGTITGINLADVLPNDMSPATVTTALVDAAATTFTLTSPTGFATGDTVIIKGAGVGGGDHEAVIGTLSGSTVTGLSPAIVTATTAPTVVVRRALVTFKTRKLFNNQVVPAIKPISGGANYVNTNTAVTGTLTINPSPEVVYGKLIQGSIHIPYKALRTDLSSSVMAIEKSELEGLLGEVSEDNPLALGVSVALANTTTRVRAIAVSSNDSVGYLGALELAQGERVYGVVPMTQDISICQAFSLHAQGMSTPENAAWRMAIVNTKIPTKSAIGKYTEVLVNANSGNNNITVASGKYVLTSSNSSFMSDGVAAGDTLNVTAGSGAPSPVGTMQILEVVSNQQIIVQAQGIATSISFYITRTLSKTQRAAAVAAQSKSFGSSRLIHVQPDTVIINVSGRMVALPGYYLACAVAGLIAGFPSQQGFTNIGVAGISDISNSNFTFTRAQLNTMSEAGTFLFVQETSGSLPYVRHELTTDMSVLEYREVQQVKNWDFLSYYFSDKLKAFIGKWNITPDTISIIRQTIVASAESLKGKKLPRVGAPLISATIDSLAQNSSNKDNLDCRLKIKMPTVLNYLNLYLVI